MASVGQTSSRYHSIKFGSDEIGWKHTWSDWRLVPTTRPRITPPSRKIVTVDIPGSDGVLDLSDVVAGRPTFQNRTGSIEFIVQNGFKPWNTLYEEIMNYLQGRKMYMILIDDYKYMYDGIFSVSDWKSETHRSKIVIDYDVYPYKKLVEDPDNVEEWRL